MDSVIAASRVVGLVLMVSAAAACGSAKPPMHSQRAQIRVQNDASRPVQGASVLVNGEAVGATSSEGRAEVQVKGVAGDKFRVNLTCPEGYRPPTPEAHEIYVTPSLSGPAPELAFKCVATSRKAIVAVRAENGAGLPVRLLGREVGRTDEQGAATVLVEVQEGESFELVLDTSRSKLLLHPQNPALTFRVGANDESFVFDQKFTIEKPRRSPAPKPYIPRQLKAPS